MSESSRLTVDTVYGKMVINRHDTIRGRSLMEYGKANDHPEIELLVELLKRRGPQSVAIDVGANFGCFALAFAPHCQRVLAFEPQPELYEMLLQTLGLATAFVRRVVEPMDCAVGAARGGMWLPEIDYNAPADFGSVRLSRDGGSRAVFGFSLDEIVYEIDRVDLLKIDVEGMEMDVLLGAEQTILKHHPILYVEYIHCDLLPLIAWIKARGYPHVRFVGNNLLADPNPVAHPVRPIVGWPDLPSITDAWPTWSQAECAEWNRLSLIVDRLTVIDELHGDENRAVERVQTRIGRPLSTRCAHGILLWIECAHCNTHVDGDLPTLLSPAALVTLERLASSAPKGCFVEVGVFKGGSAQRLYRIAEREGRTLWLFDSFVGLLDRAGLDIIPAGHFDAGGEAAGEMIQRALPNARICMGRFPEVLSVRPDVFADMRDIAFAHVDCDQYASIKKTLARLWWLMVPGGIILCDDYDALHGAHAAVNESAWELAQIRRSEIELTSEGKAVLRKP
jgi:FkbM family methyltransferase